MHEAASSSSCINTAGSEREPHHTHTQAEDASTSCPSDSSSSSGMVSSPSKGKSGKSKRGVALPPSLPSGGHWVCTLADGSEVVSEKIIVATGGLSFPAVGTDGTGHRILRSLGISVEAPYPALTPLTGAHPGGEQLAGESMAMGHRAGRHYACIMLNVAEGRWKEGG